ncbi:MAG: hypothetical protein KHZ05_05245 [Oscillospiraceae bacterium]|nr:hypothetical protein [Oscillospiraceae bacterium]
MAAGEKLKVVMASQVGKPNGVAGLDEGGKVPAGQLPAMNYDPAGSAEEVRGELNTHTGNRNNPHGVTAKQVGADPAGSAAAVQANLDAHTGNRNNPHGVTAQQVGADPAGTGAAVQQALNSHMENRGNPHGVTIQQIGAEKAWTLLGSNAVSVTRSTGNYKVVNLTIPFSGGVSEVPDEIKIVLEVNYSSELPKSGNTHMFTLMATDRDTSGASRYVMNSSVVASGTSVQWTKTVQIQSSVQVYEYSGSTEDGNDIYNYHIMDDNVATYSPKDNRISIHLIPSFSSNSSSTLTAAANITVRLYGRKS